MSPWGRGTRRAPRVRVRVRVRARVRARAGVRVRVRPDPSPSSPSPIGKGEEHLRGGGAALGVDLYPEAHGVRLGALEGKAPRLLLQVKLQALLLAPRLG